MKDHSNHDVIAPEYGFVYCSDASVVDTVEMVYGQLADMLVDARKLEAEVCPGSGSHRLEVGVQEGTKTPKAEKETSETKLKEKASADHFEIVYNRSSEEKRSKQIFLHAKGSLTSKDSF